MSLRNLSLLALLLVLTVANPGYGQGELVIGAFEGDLSAGPFGQWELGFDGDPADEPDPPFEDSILASFLTDDANDDDTEGVTQGSQSLAIDFTLWDAPFFPYLTLTGGAELAQAIVDADSLEFDYTPIPDVQENGFEFRQAFLSYSTQDIGFAQPTNQYDWGMSTEGGTFDENGVAQPEAVPFDLSLGLVDFAVEEPDFFNPVSFQEAAQGTLDAIAAGDPDAFITLRLIFQGRDLDENGDVIGFNIFNPNTVRATVDNLRLIGDFPAGTTGDYNGDGVVDAADYTVWRDNLGDDTLTNRDPTIEGPVGADDYLAWVANFGVGAGASASAIAAPEPTAAVLAWLPLLGVTGCRARRANCV